MSTPTYEDWLASAAEADESVLVLTAENRAAIRGLPPRLGPRFLDFGIAEQTMIGAAAGLALRGRRPVAHALACFLTMRAYEFIRTDVGIPRLPVKLVGGVPGFLSDANGPTHQAIEDVSIMRGIPHMGVFCPADHEEMMAGLPAVLASPDPWYVRYNPRPARVKHTEPFAPGRAEVLREGSDVALLTYGLLVENTLAAAELLSARGISATVLNMRTLAPTVDEAAIVRAAQGANLLVTIEDHFVTGGLFSITAEVLAARGIGRRVAPIGLDKKWFVPALLGDVLERERFTPPHLAARVEAALAGGAA
jgi:transketolase